MTSLPRTLNPALNPAGYMAAAGAIYAAATAIYNAVNHHGALPTPVIIAAIAAVSALLTRQVVTPVADPKDGNGDPLVTAPAPLPQAGAVHALPPQPSGASRVIIEDKAPEPPAGGVPAP